MNRQHLENLVKDLHRIAENNLEHSKQSGTDYFVGYHRGKYDAYVLSAKLLQEILDEED